MILATPIILLAQILAPIITSEPPAYYVANCSPCADGIVGDDANDGTSPTTPFLTIAHLMTVDTAAPRSVWNLHRDSVWHEMATAPRDYMTIQQYGAGANLPVLDGAVSISALAWSQPRGEGTCYQASLPVDTSAPGWINVWEDAAVVPWVASTALCDAAGAGAYYVAQDANGGATNPSTVYLRPNDGSDPATSGTLHEYSYIRSGIYTSRYGLTVNGIWTTRNFAFDGSMKLGGGGGRIYNSRLSQGSKHNMVANAPVWMYSSSADEAYFGPNGAAILQVINSGTETDKPAEFHNVTVALSAYSATVGAFGMHGVNGGDVGLISYYDCSVSNMAAAYSDAGNGSLVSNSTATNVLEAVTSNIFTTITGGTFVGHGGGNGLVKITGPGPLIISGATLQLGGTVQTNNCIYAPSATPLTITMMNSFCGGIGVGSVGSTVGVTSAVTALTASGNTINNTGFRVWALYTSVGSTVAATNNVFQAFNSNKFAYLNGTNYTYAQWKAAGYDSGSMP